MTHVDWSDDCRPIVELLGLRAGLSFRPSGRDTVEQAIGRAMRRAGYSNSADYLRLLNADADVLDDLLVETTVGETYFFRDSGQFRIISDSILPDLRRLRAPGHTIRLWSAGCASGEEAYSLAMLLHRFGALSQATVLGTDISRASLARARKGVYRAWSLRGNGVDLAKPYLTEVDGLHHVNAAIKQSVRFEYLNLALDNYPSIGSGTLGMDLILCRNVMIYFDQQTIRSVLARLSRALAPGGWLVTAASDPPIYDYDHFDFVATDHGWVYRKAGGAATAKSIPVGNTLVETSSGTSARVSTARPPAAPEVPTAGNDPRLAAASQALREGEYERAAALTTDLVHLDEGAMIHVKALASFDVVRAEKACAAETKKRPISIEMHYLYAVLLMDLNRHRESVEVLRRVLYVDGSLALVHFSLGAALRTLGDLEGARRAFRNALQICDASSPDQPVPLGDDETVGELRAMSKLQLDAVEKSKAARI